MQISSRTILKETKYMSIEYTNCMRGIFAILVVIHHLYQYSGLLRGTYISVILQLFGVLSVAMFFFFSGYGLMFSSDKKNYVEHFFSKRFIPLYCFYVFLIILYTLWAIVLENRFSLKLFLKSFLFGGTEVTNGWYLQTTFIAYLIYILVFKAFKSSKRRLVFFGVGILAYCVVCWSYNLGIIWYQTIPCMVFGMVFFYKKKNIDQLLKKYSWITFIVCSIVFVACFVLSAISKVDVIFDVLYSLFFVCAMITLSYILCNTALIDNRFTSLCGKYSLEIYVTHGLFLRLIKLQYIKNIYVYILVVIIGTILSSIIVKQVYTKMTMSFQNRVFKGI